MPQKTKVLRLRFAEHGNPQSTGRTDPDTHAWYVTQVQESTEFSPRQRLLKREVDELCASPHWRVIIDGER